MGLELHPVNFRQACEFVDLQHRHHKKPQGHKFSIGAALDGKLVGVAMVGRPVSRHVDDGKTLEVIRLCSTGEYNTCSLLYGAASRAAKAMGYHKIVTYILGDEVGSSLRASGFILECESEGGSWSRADRARTDKHPLCPKSRWCRTL